MMAGLGALAATFILGHGGGGESLGPTLSDFWDSWEIYEHGVLAGVIVGATLGLLGVYVVLRRFVFLSAAIGQTASFGVVVSLFLATHAGLQLESGEMQVPWWVPSPTVGAAVMAMLATLVILSRKERATVFREGLLGALFLIGAAGTILLGAELTHEMHAIEAILHGVGVAVLPEDFEVVAVLGTFVFVVHLFFWRGFAAVGFDPIGARVHRLPVLLLDLMMALTLALAMASGIRALGALPVFALSILPSLAAIRIAPSLPWALVLGALLGAVAGFLGYLWSFLSDWPVGATQTLVALVLAAVTELGRFLVVGSRLLRKPGGEPPQGA